MVLISGWRFKSRNLDRGWSVIMSSPIRPPLTVREADGNPTGRPINTIVVTNGSLSVSGTTATISTGGGGGGTGTVTSLALEGDTGSTSAITTNGAFKIVGAGTTTTAATGTTVTITSNDQFDGTVTSVGLTETGSALTITGSPITGSGTFNISGSGSSSQVILGDLTLGTLTSGTVTGTGLANQVSYWTAASVQAGSTGLTYDPSTGDLTVGGYVEVGTKITTPTGTDLTLDTVGGTDSGSIVIGDGVNGQVSIVANGTGTIKLGASNNPITVSNVYTLPTTVTTDNGYVLTAQTDGSTAWAASGGGGGFTGSLTDTQLAFGNTTADSIQGSARLTMDISGTSPTLTIGEAGTTNYPRLSIRGNNGFINFKDSSDNATGQIGVLSVGNGITFKTSVSNTERLRIAGDGSFGLSGANYGTSGQVITSAGAGSPPTWSTVSGGSTPKFSGVKANTNAYYDLSAYPTGWRTSSYSNISETQSAPIYLPFTCGINLTLATLGIEVSVAGDAALKYLLGIYSVDAEGLPDSKLVSATVSADATGTQTATITETSAGDGDLVAGTQYYYAYTQSFDATSNPTLRSAGAQFHGAFTDSTIGTQRQAIRAGTLGTLPSTYPGSGIVLGASVAIVGCTYG